jgi:hypothetical protein
MNDGQGWRIGLAVMCTAVMVACGPATDRVSSTAEPEPAAVVGPVTTAVDAVVAAPADAALAGIAADGETLVVAGADDDGPALWTRQGAADWHRDLVRRPGLAPGIDAVAIDGDRGVAFGGDGGGTSHLWVRDGSGAWWAVTGGGIGIDGRINAVTVDGDRWIAAGDAVDPEAGEAYEGVLWASRDGRAFRVLATGLDLAEGTVTDVAAADGTVVVVGFDVTGGRVWTSSDGDRFSPAAGTFGAMTMHGVAATSDGFVILGRGVGDLAPRAWRSADGRTWEMLDIDDAGVAPDDEIHDVTTFGDTVVAVGGSPAGGVVWTLEDGRLVRAGS